MKKFAALLVMLVLVFSPVLVGCGGDDGGGSTDTPAETTEDAPSE
jgi:hypothetical protein